MNEKRHANTNQKKAGITTFTQNKVDFRQTRILTNEEEYFIMIKWPVIKMT